MTNKVARSGTVGMGQDADRRPAPPPSLLAESGRFELLLVELSATFVNVAADHVDAQIEQALRHIVQFLGVDRSGFGEYLEDQRQLLVTHSYAAPGVAPFPRSIVDDQLPWYAERIRRGEVLRFARLPDELPPEAAREREYVARVGIKSNLTIPLKVSGAMLGAIAVASFRTYRDWPDALVARLRLLGEILANAVVRKRGEEALRAKEQRLRKTRDDLRLLAGKLLQAHEEERRRIAREMHDDWTQRLAVLAIDAARLEQQLGSCHPCFQPIQTMREQMVCLSEDVHALSRQLHPSILDDLGLADALLSECASVTRREGIAVAYHPEGVPPLLPREVALCVYRVAQEALRNVVRHARVKAARVSLAGTDRELVLSVQDDGIGFDPAGARSQPALGLSSMEERVRLIQAELSIRSAPGRGTTVTVRVPQSGKGT